MRTGELLSKMCLLRSPVTQWPFPAFPVENEAYPCLLRKSKYCVTVYECTKYLVYEKVIIE